MMATPLAAMAAVLTARTNRNVPMASLIPVKNVSPLHPVVDPGNHRRSVTNSVSAKWRVGQDNFTLDVFYVPKSVSTYPRIKGKYIIEGRGCLNLCPLVLLKK